MSCSTTARLCPLGSRSVLMSQWLVSMCHCSGCPHAHTRRPRCRHSNETRRKPPASLIGVTDCDTVYREHTQARRCKDSRDGVRTRFTHRPEKQMTRTHGRGLRCEDVTGQGGGQLTQNQEGGRGGFFAESFFRNQREGRWLVLGGIEAQSWGLRMGRE